MGLIGLVEAELWMLSVYVMSLMAMQRKIKNSNDELQ